MLKKKNQARFPWTIFHQLDKVWKMARQLLAAIAIFYKRLQANSPMLTTLSNAFLWLQISAAVTFPVPPPPPKMNFSEKMMGHSTMVQRINQTSDHFILLWDYKDGDLNQFLMMWMITLCWILFSFPLVLFVYCRVATQKFLKHLHFHPVLI